MSRCALFNRILSFCFFLFILKKKFQVKSIEDEVFVTGQAKILLGTTREPIKQIVDSSSEDTSVVVPGTSGDLYRSGSESSIHSQRSIYSTPIAYSVPANLNLSVDEPDEDEEDEDYENDHEHISPSTSTAHLRPTNSPSPHHSRQIRSHSHHDITETLQEEDEVMEEPFPSATYHTTSENSLLSLPTYSQIQSRKQSTETCKHSTEPKDQ